MARKGLYHEWLKPDNLERLRGWARDGDTDEIIAKKIGINKTTLYDWKKRFPELADALKKGKEIVDIEVENALLDRAIGYYYWEEKEIPVKMDREEYDEKLEYALEVWEEQNPKATEAERNLFIAEFPKYKMVVVERKKKHVPGDTTAQIFWLKNRKPGNYRDELHKAQQRLIEKKAELLEGAKKDTTLLEALGEIFKEDNKKI